VHDVGDSEWIACRPVRAVEFVILGARCDVAVEVNDEPAQGHIVTDD